MEAQLFYWDGTKWLPDRPAQPANTVPRRRSRDWFATIIMLLGLVVIVFPGNPSQASGPRLKASPQTARPGDILRISGTGFLVRSTIQLAWDGLVSQMPTVNVTGAGTFNARVVVTDSTPGPHLIAAMGTATTVAAKGVTGVAALESVASVSVTVLAVDPSDTPSLSSRPSATPEVTPPPKAQPTQVATAQPTGAPPPPAGLPAINPAYGTVFRKVFTDGTLAPFKVLTYPDDHIGQPGQYMTVYNRFSNGAGQVSVHNGYLDLRATPRADGLWNAALVGTSQSGNGPTFGYGVYRFWLSFNIGPSTWQGAWLYDTTTWSATEIDFPEMLENLSLTAHVLGSGAGGQYGLPKPANLASVFHEFKVERRATFVAFSLDGVQVARVTGSMPATKLAILLQSTVGHPWMAAAGAPSASTPNPTYFRVAAITVDP
jgi:Glycosyl hydrolases family 16